MQWLVLCGKSVENLSWSVVKFGRVCKKYLKVNVENRKVMLMNEEDTQCRILQGDQLEEVSGFGYLNVGWLHLKTKFLYHSTHHNP